MLGIDLSLRYSGLSVFTSVGIHQRCMTIEEILERGSKHDPPIPEPERIARILRIANEIVRVVRIFRIRHVGMEGYAHDARYQSHQLGEVAGVVKSQLWLNFGIAPRICPPSSARKHVIGYGGSVSKTDIQQAVSEGLGIVAANHHEADASVVGRYTFDMVAAEEQEAR